MSDFIELRTILSALLRKWWLLALGALLGGTVGFLVSNNQPEVYRATTSLFVGRPIESAELNRFDIENSMQLARIYANIARRQPVLEGTVNELNLPIPWVTLREQVATQVGRDTQLLDISAEAATPEQARLIADEIARQLILVSPNGLGDIQQAQAQAFTREQVDRLQTKIEEGQVRLEQYEEALLAETDSEDASALQNEIAMLDSMITRWEANYAQMLSFVSTEQPSNNLAILEPAQASPTPVQPQVLFVTLIAAVIGAALATGLIVLRELFNNNMETPEDVTRLTGLRTLGGINQISGKDPSQALVVNHDSFSPVLEDYRLLRTKIQFQFADSGGHTVLVTSPGRGDGKSLTIANLGIVMAQAGLRTIIVDANLRQPIQHELFQLPNQDGLTHLLRGKDENVTGSIASTMVPNLKVLVSGSLPTNPSELLGSLRMRQLIEQLSGMADFVLFDSSEVLTVADTSVLSRFVDGVVLVVEAGNTDRRSTVQAVVNLRDARANLLGTVLNRISSQDRLLVFNSGKLPPMGEASPPEQPMQDLSYAESASD